MGGLARRASFIEMKRTSAEKNVTRLFVAGPYELAATDGGRVPAMRAPLVVARAHAAMGYDAMLLTPADLALTGAPPPKGLARWAELPRRAKGEVLIRNGLRIAVVRFPMAEGIDGRPTEEQFRQAREEGIHLRREADVVIGISPWGAHAEQAFLERFAAATQPYDVLLGGGPGPGHSGRIAGGGSATWLRPYPQGKAVQWLRLDGLPKKRPDVWLKRETDVRFGSVSLDGSVPEDKTINDLLREILAAD